MEIPETVLLLNTIVGLIVFVAYLARSKERGFKPSKVNPLDYLFDRMPKDTFTKQPYAEAHMWLIFILGFLGFFWLMVSVMKWATVGACYHCICFAAMCAIWLEYMKRTRFITSLIYGHGKWDDQIILGAFVGLVFAIMGLAVSQISSFQVISNLQIMQFVSIKKMPVATILISAVMVPIAEEVGFRGLLLPTLSEDLGAVPGILISSFLFMIYHGYVYQAAILPLLCCFGFACVAATLALKYKSVLPGLVGHGLVNTTAILLSVVGPMMVA